MNHSTEQNRDDKRIKTLEAIHDEAVDAIVTIDSTGLIASVNPATEALFGYSADQLIGRNVKMLMPNPYRDAHDGYLSNYLESGIKKIIGIGREVVGQRNDGSTFPLHLAVSEIVVGTQRLFAGVIRDLTEFKQLEQQETTLGRIVEDSLNEVFIFDSDSLRFLQVNRGARQNLGRTIEELREMTPVDIKPDFDEAKFRQTIQPLMDDEVPILEFETRHIRKDGTTYEVEVHLQKSTYRDCPAFVAIIWDVTQRRMMQREVNKQREAIQKELEQLVESRTQDLRETQAELVQAEKFATLGKVSGGIAHEIRNPLNAVKTSAYYLLNAKNASEAKVREHLERIDRQVAMIDNVVTALSDVAKLPEANLTPVNIAPFILEAVHSIELPAGIEVENLLEADLPEVLVDEHQVLIAFKNLVRNARDAMPEGGTISVSADVAEDTISFHVGDNGCGISPENLRKILEPLFTTKARGMGLGLSITRAVVEKNDGKLSVQSELGIGSQFSVTLKRAN